MPDLITTVKIVPRSPQNTAEMETLFDEMAASAVKGPGVRLWAYFGGDDGSYRLLERFENPEAEMYRLTHLDQEKLGRLAELAEFRDLEVLGETTPELETALADFSPVYRQYLTGVL